MEKGLSPIVSVMLILLIAISITVLAMIWLPRMTFRFLPDMNFNESYERSRGCLSIEDVKGLFGFVAMKNCGKTILSDFRFFIDGKFVSRLGISSLEPGQSVDFYEMPIEGGMHEIYITADNAESPPYKVNVPFWECTGGEPILVSNWYVSKNMSCVCSYNSVIPVDGNIYVIENGSLSINRCTLRSHGLFVRNLGNFSAYKSKVYFYVPVEYPKFEASGNSNIRFINSTIDQDSDAYWSPVVFGENSISYFNYSTVSSLTTVTGSSSNYYNNSRFSWFNIDSVLPHTLYIDDFYKGQSINDYIWADGSNFKISLINTDVLYPMFYGQYYSNNILRDSSIHQLYIVSNVDQNLNITNFRHTGGTYVKNLAYAGNSNFKVNLTNVGGVTWAVFQEDGTVCNNTIFNSSFNRFSSRYKNSNYNISNSDFGVTHFYAYNNVDSLTAAITNSYLGDLELGWAYYDTAKINLTFRNSNFSTFYTQRLTNSDIRGNLTATGPVNAWIGSTISRYYPTIVRDLNNQPFPTAQPATITIRDRSNQTIWQSSVSGGASPIAYYTEEPKIIFNQLNYMPGSFVLNVSQVCENITDINFMNSTPLNFTVKRAFEYDNSNFSTPQAMNPRGLAYNGTRFFVASSNGNVYVYNSTGSYTGSFNSGLNGLRDIATNGTHLWLLNYNASEKKVYRYLSTGSYNNWFFIVTDALEPHAVDFDGDNFWVLGSNSIYKYNNVGVYTGFSFSLNRIETPLSYPDMIASSGNIWILADTYSETKGRGVFRYRTDGSYDNWYFDISPAIVSGYGLAYNGTHFWAMSSTGTVFRYSLNKRCLESMKNCDEFIAFLPYTISKNNTRYCLLYDTSVYGKTAITFSSGVQNSALECSDYKISGNAFINAHGIHLTGSNTKNNTVSNCVITGFGNGIYLNSGTNNNTLIKNKVFGNGQGISLDNTMNNNILNGSIFSNNLDYYLSNSTNNKFISTNFTYPRTVFFKDHVSQFIYNNKSSSNIFLNTNVSNPAKLDRKIVNWNQTSLKWNDTSNFSANVRYGITGLISSTYYKIYNNSALLYDIPTDSEGNLQSFIVYLRSGQETEITVQENTDPPYVYFVVPTDNNGATVNRNYSYVNVSIADFKSTSSLIDWNRSLVGYWAMDWHTSTIVFDNSSYNNLGTFNGGYIYSPETSLSPDSNGYIRDWLVIGTFYESDCACDGGDCDSFISETSTSKYAGLSEGGQTWFEHHNTDSHIDLDNEVFGGDNVVAYAFAVVYSPSSRDIQLRLGSDDGIKAWLNGDLVVNNGFACRGASPDQDVVPVTLNQGYNYLLLRIGERGGGWGFFARFTDTFGNPQNDLKIMPNLNKISGKYGSSLQFDGRDDFIDAGNSISLNPVYSLTVETWVKLANYSSPSYARILEKGRWEAEPNIYGSYRIVRDTATSGVNFEIYNTSSRSNSCWFGWLDVGQWHHLVGSYNSSGIWCYVDGSLVYYNEGNYGNIQTTSDRLLIGANYWGGENFNGAIDEVRIWNRVLSLEEIRASFNSGLYRLFRNFTNITNGNYQYYAYAINAIGKSNKTETRTLTVNA